MTISHLQPLLELRDISKRFHRELVLNNISMKIYSGEITALIGNNGAGKSTLSKIINGYEKHDGGKIYWQGNLINYPQSKATLFARRLGIETVYQDLGLIDNLSLAQNFFLGNELTRGYFPFLYLDMKRMNTIVMRELHRFGLEKYSRPHVNINVLSGGERQTFSICRAMYFNSKLLILDEPSSALSYQQAAIANASILAAAQKHIAILLISHNKEQIHKVADRIIVLNQGRIAVDTRKDEQHFSTTLNQM